MCIQCICFLEKCAWLVHVLSDPGTNNLFHLSEQKKKKPLGPPALLLEKLHFHEHQHGTRGRQQGDFRPFQPASLAGRISFTNRAPLLWNMLPREVQTWNMLPREVQTSSSMLIFKKKVLSLLDSCIRQEPFTDLFWKHYHLITFLLFFLFFFFPFALDLFK